MVALPQHGLVRLLGPAQHQVQIVSAAVDLQLDVVKLRPFAIGSAAEQPQAAILLARLGVGIRVMTR